MTEGWSAAWTSACHRTPRKSTVTGRRSHASPYDFPAKIAAAHDAKKG
jgi:hypothetical protein